MTGHYNVYLAVDFFNSDILFVANSSGELSQKIITAIANHELESDGAVRLYRTSTESLTVIKQLMSRYRLPFHEAAKPKGIHYDNHTINSVG